MNAADAKSFSERYLTTAGVLVNPQLPTIEEPAELTPRSPQQVAIRAWVMSHVAYLGYGNTGEQMPGLLRRSRLDGYLTPKEVDLCATPRLTDHQKAWAAWQCESVHGCAWALGMVESDVLDACPPTLASMFPLQTDPWKAIEHATLRSAADIYQRADTLYRLHWAAVEARLTGVQIQLPEPAIMFRRQSLDWIAGIPYEWDDVPLNT